MLPVGCKVKSPVDTTVTPEPTMLLVLTLPPLTLPVAMTVVAVTNAFEFKLPA